MNLPPLPDLRAAENPLGPAVADDNTDLNNAQFLAAVQRAAASLRGHGVSAGDVVAIMLPNTASFVVSLFAAWRIGAAVTPINPSLRPAEVTYQVSDAAAKVLIVERRPNSTPVWRQSTTDQLDCGEPTPGADAPHYADDALALLIYTSGTTGRPKGVMLDHANLNAMCGAVIDGFKLTGADHSLLILPLFHVNGIVVGTLSPLLAGGRATVAGRFKPDTFFDRIEQSRATYFSAVPTIYTMLCGSARQREARHLVRALRRSAGPRRPAWNCSRRSNPATASRSSRGTGCRKDRAPARSIRWTASARPGRWDYPCPARRSASSTRRATRCPTARPARS